jgi:hypothetical protein
MIDVTPKTVPRLRGLVIAVLLCTAQATAVRAADYGFAYRDGCCYPYGGYGLYRDPGLRNDVNRMTDQLQRQQRQLDEQMRQQQDQARLLREQQSRQLQLTGMQACYYRFNGALDLCDRLFDTASARHAACVEAAVELNPGCAPTEPRPPAPPAD